MPVTFKVSHHPAESTLNSKRHTDVSKVLEIIAPQFDTGNKKKVLQSSLTKSDLACLVPSSNGFVYGCLEAYNMHHNLVLRPDDVWITIMSQFATYVEAHESEMREHFVRSEIKGKSKVVVFGNGDRYTADFGDMAMKMGAKLETIIKDKDLRAWIIPDFSTTTSHDQIVGAILMMCTLKNYFTYRFSLRCGIPEVTLAGSKSDWETLRTRLDKLLSFGDAEAHPQLHAWHQLLVPIFDNFVDCFIVFDPAAAITDESAPRTSRADELVYFFQRICAITENGSGPRYLSGWLSFFCAFGKDGKWQLKKAPNLPEETSQHYQLLGVDPGIYGEKNAAEKDAPVWLPHIDENDIPAAYGEVDVELDDNSQLMDTKMVAGMVGYDIGGENMDTIKLTTGWWMFITGDKSPKQPAKYSVPSRILENWRTFRKTGIPLSRQLSKFR